MVSVFLLLCLVCTSRCEAVEIGQDLELDDRAWIVAVGEDLQKLSIQAVKGEQQEVQTSGSSPLAASSQPRPLSSNEWLALSADWRHLKNKDGIIVAERDTYLKRAAIHDDKLEPPQRHFIPRGIVIAAKDFDPVYKPGYTKVKVEKILPESAVDVDDLLQAQEKSQSLDEDFRWMQQELAGIDDGVLRSLADRADCVDQVARKGLRTPKATIRFSPFLRFPTFYAVIRSAGCCRL
eukprot:SAG31_NODE_5241_length_2656_cov_1.481424_3_plen_236_part_00